jgi:hypothetical protein
MHIKDTLLPGWTTWDTGNYDLPAKDVTLKDGRKGSIIIGTEGVCVYDRLLDDLAEAEDMGVCFIDMRETPDKFDELQYLLSEKDIEESKMVFEKYMEYEKSFE